MLKQFFFTLALLAGNIMLVYSAAPKAPTNLRTCDKVQPVGTEATPFFGWYINDPDDNEIQTAFQLLIASSPQLLAAGNADVWDSKKVLSGSQNYISYAGKTLQSATRYYWKVRSWDKDGNVSPYSAVTYFDAGLFNNEDWAGAKWIKRDTKDANDYTYFRKQIQLEKKKVKRAIVYLTAFHNYDLYINGKQIGKGLAHHYPQYAYYNAYDVTNSLSIVNTFAAMTHWYGGGQGRAKGDRGFLLKLMVEYTDDTQYVTGTDNSWKQIAVESFDPKTKNRNGEGVGYIDIIDSRKQITDWYQPSFNDSNWKQATEIGVHPVAPFTGTLQADLTRLKEKTIKPVSVKNMGNGRYIIDLGKIYAGMPEIAFEGGHAGDTLNMRGGFVLNEDGTVSDKITQHTNLNYFFILNGKKAIFKPVVYLGYRYLQVENSPVVLNANNVSFTTRHYELAPERSFFVSSNPMLNMVWQLMIHSLTLGAQEGFVDTPTREKGEFLGDSYCQAVAAIMTMGERALTNRVLLEFLDSQDQYWPDGRLNAVYPNVDGKRDIPDFTQQYLLWVWDYFMQTGNTSFLKDNYEKLKKVANYVDAYTNKTTGLIHNLAGGSGAYQYGIVDWPATMRYGYDMSTEARTVINGYAYRDFSIMASIAKEIGNEADEKLYNTKAGNIKAAMNKLLLNKDGIYIDGLLADGSQSSHVSQHANMFPLGLGIVPATNAAAVTDAVKQRKMSAGMVTVRMLLQSMGEAGEGNQLLELLTNKDWDGWANSISKGATATWESWDALESDQSMCHPWGTTGLIGIQQYVLGIKTLKPQHELIEIKPLEFNGRLQEVSGKMPTDKGDISVSWKQTNENYQLRLSLPDNVKAHVYLPVGTSSSGSKITMDGKAIKAIKQGNYWLMENVGSGNHVFVRI